MLRTLWQSRRLGMCITNLEGDILDVNDTYCRLLGYGRDDLLQSSIYNLTEHEDDLNPAEYGLRDWYEEVIQQTRRSMLELPEDETDIQLSSTIQRGTASVAWVDVAIVAETALWQKLQTRQGEFVDIEADLICGEITGSELLVLHVVRPLSISPQPHVSPQPQKRQVDIPAKASLEPSPEATVETTVEATMQMWLHNAPEVLETILPDSVAILDRDGIYHDIKDAAYYIPFTTVEESLGKTIEEALPNPLASDLRRALTKVFTSRERQYVRSTLPVGDSVRHYETRLHYVDESVCVSATHDITTQVALERRAQQSDAKTKAIIEAIPDSIVILSREGVYQETHSPSNFKFVYHNANWDGKHIDDVPVPPNVAKPLKHHIARLFETNTSQRYTYDIDIEDETRRREVTLTRIDNTSCVMLVRDLTATIDLSERLTRAINALSLAPSLADAAPATQAQSEQNMSSTTLLEASPKPLLNPSLELLPDIIVRMNRQGVYTQIIVPEGAALLTDITADELIGKTFEEVTPPELLSSARRYFEEAFSTGTIQTFSYEITHQDQIYYREARLIPINNNELVSIVRDFSDYYAIQHALEQREQHFKTLVDALPDGIAIFDRTGTYLEVSLSQYDTHVPAHVANLIGKTVDDILPTAIAQRVQDCIEQALDSQRLQVYTYAIEQDGRNYYREARFVRLTNTNVLAVLRDVTAQHLSQSALEQHKQRLQMLLNTLPDAILQISTEGVISDIQIADDFIVIANAPVTEGKELKHLLPPDAVDDIQMHVQRAIDTGQLQLRYYQVSHRGETYYREMRLMRFDDSHVLTVTRDITEQQRSRLALEHSEQQTRAILQALPDAIVRLDHQGNTLEEVHKGNFEPVFSLATRLDQPFDSFTRPQDARGLREQLAATFVTKRMHLYAYTLTQDNTTHYREIRFVYLNEDECLGLIRDVTEEHEMGNALQVSLHHSEALLKEVHHRVRNNLQVLSSILHLHATSLKEPLAKQALNDNRRRIQTLAAVHRVLYENESYADIALDKYLRSTLRLFSQELASWKIALQLDICSVQVNLDQAIPFGLIANELLSNAARHAFPVGAVSEPQIEVSLHQHEVQVVFRVQDNGVGLPHDFAELCQQNLGISIASSLTQQLDGKVTINSVDSPVGGSVAMLEFPLAQR
ncbi:MAG: PAS domain-containing protein [Deinococcota bacterium]